jgi:hypothetical protein
VRAKATIEASKGSVPAFRSDMLPPQRDRHQLWRDWSEFGAPKLHNPVGSGLGYNFGQIRVNSDAKAVARPQSCTLGSTTPKFCPFGGACHTCPAQVQAKRDIDEIGDVFEQEADRVAGEAMHAPGDPGLPKRSYAEQLSRISPTIQRAAAAPTTAPPIAGPTAAAVSGPETAVPGLILEDNEEAIHPGQMKKSEFLSRLRVDVCAAANAILAATGRTTDDCPYLNFWLNYYSSQTNQHIEQAIRRYAPETAAVTTAGDYIALIVDRVSRAVAAWATTGQVTGVPAGVSTAAPSAAGPGGAAATPAKTGGVQLKGREGGGRGTGNLQAIQSQLGSGKPLDSGVRSHMESAFGFNFSRVRVHTDAAAAGAANNLNARAFTIGKDIAFGPGEYAPGSLIGNALIAHELAHVVQQTGAIGHELQHKGGSENNALEVDADVSAIGAMVSGWRGLKGALKDIGKKAMPRLRSGLHLQRCVAAPPAAIIVGEAVAGGAAAGGITTGGVLFTVGGAAGIAGLTQLESDVATGKSEMAQHGKGNVADTGIVNEAQALIAAGTVANICAALELLMAAARAARDTAKMLKIKATQKAYGCRRHRE